MSEVEVEGRTNACLNCGAPLAGEYCKTCGQRRHIHRTMMSLLHDLAHGVLHFEGKIWRTLPMLAFKPGEVTRRYINGERAKFVSPLALFLFSIFVLAAVLGSIPYNSTLIGFGDGVQEGWNSVDRQNGQDAATKPELAKPVSSRVTNSADQAQATPRSSWIKDRLDKARQNPDLSIYKIKNSAYKFSWVLVPMSIPFMWLLFPLSRRFGAYDHAIFVIYSIASISLLAVLFAVIQTIPGLGLAATVSFAILAPVHIYRQLRGAYSLGRVAALFRVALLIIAILVVLSIWTLFLILVGAA